MFEANTSGENIKCQWNCFWKIFYSSNCVSLSPQISVVSSVFGIWLESPTLNRKDGGS